VDGYYIAKHCGPLWLAMGWEYKEKMFYPHAIHFSWCINECWFILAHIVYLGEGLLSRGALLIQSL